MAIFGGQINEPNTAGIKQFAPLQGIPQNYAGAALAVQALGGLATTVITKYMDEQKEDAERKAERAAYSDVGKLYEKIGALKSSGGNRMQAAIELNRGLTEIGLKHPNIELSKINSMVDFYEKGDDAIDAELSEIRKREQDLADRADERAFTLARDAAEMQFRSQESAIDRSFRASQSAMDRQARQDELTNQRTFDTWKILTEAAREDKRDLAKAQMDAAKEEQEFAMKQLEKRNPQLAALQSSPAEAVATFKASNIIESSLSKLPAPEELLNLPEKDRLLYSNKINSTARDVFNTAKNHSTTIVANALRQDFIESTDENGNPVKIPVYDAQGKVSAQALPIIKTIQENAVAQGAAMMTDFMGAYGSYIDADTRKEFNAEISEQGKLLNAETLTKNRLAIIQDLEKTGFIETAKKIFIPFGDQSVSLYSAIEADLTDNPELQLQVLKNMQSMDFNNPIQKNIAQNIATGETNAPVKLDGMSLKEQEKIANDTVSRASANFRTFRNQDIELAARYIAPDIVQSLQHITNNNSGVLSMLSNNFNTINKFPTAQKVDIVSNFDAWSNELVTQRAVDIGGFSDNISYNPQLGRFVVNTPKELQDNITKIEADLKKVKPESGKTNFVVNTLSNELRDARKAVTDWQFANKNRIEQVVEVNNALTLRKKFGLDNEILISNYEKIQP